MKTATLVLGCVLGLVGLAPGVGAAGDARDRLMNGFSVDVITHVETGGRTTVMRSKRYCSKDKIRIDTAAETDGHAAPDSGAIIRLDQHVQWVLMPEQHQYMELPIKPEDEPRIAAMSRDLSGDWAALTPVGTAVIDGQTADKYDQSNDKCTIYTYVSSSSHLPLKSEGTCADAHTVTEYQNVRAGAQPADLFELPAGYQKFTLPQ